MYRVQVDHFGLVVLTGGLRVFTQQGIAFTPDSIVAADFDVRFRPCGVHADELELGVVCVFIGIDCANQLTTENPTAVAGGKA